ncbi:hypothetical protein BN2497_9743 [Janthinobacterium sp. CG23_2]|nr:hypothetical protein BN2497_9743 [Janthinobacterium sp. CG23_2]CUU31269.1 hypothetical protein BN3177_9743 [Janthinobacterium sp. CG23_2]
MVHCRARYRWGNDGTRGALAGTPRRGPLPAGSGRVGAT